MTLFHNKTLQKVLSDLYLKCVSLGKLLTVLRSARTRSACVYQAGWPWACSTAPSLHQGLAPDGGRGTRIRARSLCFWPQRWANLTAVCPSQSGSRARAPQLTSSSMHSQRPMIAATCSAVLPSGVLECTSAPAKKHSMSVTGLIERDNGPELTPSHIPIERCHYSCTGSKQHHPSTRFNRARLNLGWKEHCWTMHISQEGQRAQMSEPWKQNVQLCLYCSDCKALHKIKKNWTSLDNKKIEITKAPKQGNNSHSCFPFWIYLL